tara:strand:- start:663 stop:1541 length:879 start_codon:yes stop_codon:yes gene_type:complete
MAKFGWAYIDCADSGQAFGPTGSVQFMSASGNTTGSVNFMYYSASESGYAANTLVLTGTLAVSGTISASMYHVEDIALIDATGSTYFGDDQTDNHSRTGSFQLHSDSAQVFKIDSPSGNLSGSGTLTIAGNGIFNSDVGIGTASPAKNLHLYGSSGEVELRIQSDTSYCSIVQKDNAELIIQNAASNGVIIFHDDTAERMRIDSDGKVGIGTTNPSHLLTVAGAISAESTVPSADDTYNLGSPARRWANIYTADLHLKNERGNWTVVEEENYLTLRNNKTGKKYKLLMEEID